MRSNALATTISAWVESSPPETGEPLDLDVERLVAVLVERRGGVGDEGEAADAAFESHIGEVGAVVERDAADAGLGVARGARSVVEGAEAEPLLRQPPAVDVGDAQLGIAREAGALGDQLAQLVDGALTVPGEVGGALAGAARRIDIGADRAGGLGRGEHHPLARLAHDDVRGAEVGADQRSRERA